MQQTTDTVVMISPDSFRFNIETAKTNTFQNNLSEYKNSLNAAMHEFANMVRILKNNNIHVITLPSREDVITPDAVFPNNWFSIHKELPNKITLVLYAMLNENRRAERQVDVLKVALKKQNIHITDIVDLTAYEKENKSLEGTGSLVLDRVNNIAYASLSPRTDQIILNEFASKLGYSLVVFHSYDQYNHPIYHTNVMMSIGTHFAVIALESITDITERTLVVESLLKSEKVIIDISLQQMCGMAANILEMKSCDGKSKIIMSENAYHAFTNSQQKILHHFGELIRVDIDVIEKLGGGSARCMLAEIFY